jgi:hypothetical protein
MATPELPKVSRFKKGVTFLPTCTIPLTGSLTSLLGVGIASSVTTVDGKEWVCAVTILDNRKFRLRIDESITKSWTTGDATWDIKFKINGQVIATDTILLRIVKSPTSTVL